jgi:pimeloyl-ACP methyl ester carboxylesterase
LVLIGASPGIEDPEQREARRSRDGALAAELERDGVAAFLARWLAQPMFDGVPLTDDRASNTAAGLAASLRCSGTGAMEPLWDRLPQIGAPVQLLAGERDAKFAAIARRMAALLPNARGPLLISGVGHAAHILAPAEVGEAIDAFLVSLEGGRES